MTERATRDRPLRRLARRLGSADRGAALVEFAILAPLIFMLLFGLITGGMAMSQRNSMSNAVREGSRLGATLPADDGAAWTDAVRDRVSQLAAGDLRDNQICVKLDGAGDAHESILGGEGGCTEDQEPDTPDGESCVVKVWARRTASLNAILFQRTLTLDVGAVALFERGGEGSCP